MSERPFPSSFPERFLPLARKLAEAGEENRVFEGNSFEIITSGLRKRELLLEDIRRARRYIHLEYYRFGNDKAGREVRDLLMQKAAEGVEVRFLNNNLSAWMSIPSSYFKKMTGSGVEVIPFTHIRHGFGKWLFRINHQQHRKVVVIDGQVAFTGGMNLNDNYFYKWRDTHLRITGPVVEGLNASFMESWRASGGRFSFPPEHYASTPVAQPAPFRDKLMQIVSDSPETPQSAMLTGYEWILDNARDYVYIQTPYFVPPPSLVEAFRRAVQRGVDVSIMLPKNIDTPLMGPTNRAYYADCLEAGVRILEREGEFIHCKTLVADDEISLVGASNLDWRSFFVNYEINVLIYDRETALYGKQVFEADRQLAQTVRLQEWLHSRRWYQAAFSRFMRLFYFMM